MNKAYSFGSAVVLGAAMFAAAPAFAEDPIITFGYTDLAASFTDGLTMNDRVFRARAVALPGGFNTAGNVNRIDITPSQTAAFPAGFFGAGLANFEVEMNVATGAVGPLAATGSFTITDMDGDTISGMLAGEWFDLGFGFEIFQGLISLGTIAPSGLGDNAHFNGPGDPTNSFMYAGLPMTGLSGSFVQLQLTSGVFFDADFANISSQSTGVLVPAPAGAALLAAAGLLGARRRRR